MGTVAVITVAVVAVAVAVVTVTVVTVAIVTVVTIAVALVVPYAPISITIPLSLGGRTTGLLRGCC